MNYVIPYNNTSGRPNCRLGIRYEFGGVEVGDKTKPRSSRARRFVQKMHGLDASLKLLISVGTSIVAVVGALIAGFAYVTEQVNAAIDERVGEVEQKLEVQRQEQELSLTRLELLMLIEYDPTNKVEIEKLAKKYFNPPYNGDQYMTSIVSKWCDEQDIECGTIILN